MGMTIPIFSIPLFPVYFYNLLTTCFQSNITFIFDGCHRRLAAVTSVKYEYSDNLLHNFEEWNWSQTDKLVKEFILVTPTQGPMHRRDQSHTQSKAVSTIHDQLAMRDRWGVRELKFDYTVKPVCNDHLYNKMNYLWFIQ